MDSSRKETFTLFLSYTIQLRHYVFQYKAAKILERVQSFSKRASVRVQRAVLLERTRDTIERTIGANEPDGDGSDRVPTAERLKG